PWPSWVPWPPWFPWPLWVPWCPWFPLRPRLAGGSLLGGLLGVLVRLVLLVAAERHDLERRQVRASAAVHAHPLLRLIAQDLDSRAALVREHFGLDLEPVDARRSNLDVVAFMQQQDA